MWSISAQWIPQGQAHLSKSLSAATLGDDMRAWQMTNPKNCTQFHKRRKLELLHTKKPKSRCSGQVQWVPLTSAFPRLKNAFLNPRVPIHYIQGADPKPGRPQLTTQSANSSIHLDGIVVLNNGRGYIDEKSCSAGESEKCSRGYFKATCHSFTKRRMSFSKKSSILIPISTLPGHKRPHQWRLRGSQRE